MLRCSCLDTTHTGFSAEKPYWNMPEWLWYILMRV
jgi:hypothetical protein